MSFINQVFDFFLPRFCPSCQEKLLPTELFVCEQCLQCIQKADDFRIQNEFNRKFKHQNIIKDFSALYVFEQDKSLQHVIHHLKYKENFRLGIFLGKLLASEMKDKMLSWSADIIIPVPLYSLKKAERGYNQSFFIAKGINSICRVPIKQNILKRKRFTQTQTALSLVERKENVKDAFSLRRRKLITNKRIILVDDVITTGATISECGRVLLENGASNVYAASVAIAD